MKRLTMLLLFLITATASAQWLDNIDTVTTGNFNDIDPQIDHAGLLTPIFSIDHEWVVFERWSDSTDAIAAVRRDTSVSESFTGVITISPSRVGLMQEYPDVCTMRNGTSIAAWQEKSDSIWNICYSVGNIGGGSWSAPAQLTQDSVSNTEVEVRPLTDSSLVLLWKRKNAILYSIFKSGVISVPDTLVVSNTDSTEFDLDPYDFVWTERSASGEDYCLEAAVTDTTGIHVASPDSIGIEGSMSYPRFTITGGQAGKTFTFDDYSCGRYSVWWYFYYGINGWRAAALESGTGADYVHVVQLNYPIPVSDSRSPIRTVQSYQDWMVASEKLTSTDTSIAFLGAFPDSLEPGSNPVISPLAYVVWQSRSAGLYHLYAREYAFKSTGIHQPAAPPSSYILSQNYPNPFNPSTVIGFVVRSSGFVSLKVYDVLGREVATLVDGRESAGTHSVVFDGSRFASGVYFYRLNAGGSTQVRKMILMK